MNPEDESRRESSSLVDNTDPVTVNNDLIFFIKKISEPDLPNQAFIDLITKVNNLAVNYHMYVNSNTFIQNDFHLLLLKKFMETKNKVLLKLIVNCILNLCNKFEVLKVHFNNQHFINKIFEADKGTEYYNFIISIVVDNIKNNVNMYYIVRNIMSIETLFYVLYNTTDIELLKNIIVLLKYYIIYDDFDVKSYNSILTLSFMILKKCKNVVYYDLVVDILSFLRFLIEENKFDVLVCKELELQKTLREILVESCVKMKILFLKFMCLLMNKYPENFDIDIEYIIAMIKRYSTTHELLKVCYHSIFCYLNMYENAISIFKSHNFLEELLYTDIEKNSNTKYSMILVYSRLLLEYDIDFFVNLHSNKVNFMYLIIQGLILIRDMHIEYPLRSLLYLLKISEGTHIKEYIIQQLIYSFTDINFLDDFIEISVVSKELSFQIKQIFK